MPAHLTDEELRRRLAKWLECNRNASTAAKGYISMTGARVAPSAFRDSIRAAKDKGLTPTTIQAPNEFDDSPIPEPPKLRITISTRASDPGFTGDVVVIGDAHDSPKIPDKARFLWAGRYIADLGIQKVIQIGDFFSFDSLTRFDGNETLIGKTKPSFEADINSGHDALTAFDRGLGGHKPETKHECLGNHENRAINFTNKTPEIAGILTGAIDNLLMSHKWTYSPYGLVYFIGSVGFVHVPLNKLGRPYGGKTAGQRIANDCLHDLGYGHDHAGGEVVSQKIGTNQKITVLNAGCFLPDMHVEQYVGHGISGWKYGINRLHIEDGRLASSSFTTMRELEQKYGD